MQLMHNASEYIDQTDTEQKGQQIGLPNFLLPHDKYLPQEKKKYTQRNVIFRMTIREKLRTIRDSFDAIPFLVLLFRFVVLLGFYCIYGSTTHKKRVYTHSNPEYSVLRVEQSTSVYRFAFKHFFHPFSSNSASRSLHSPLFGLNKVIS